MVTRVAVIGLLQPEVGLDDYGGAVPGGLDVSHMTRFVATDLGSIPPCTVFIDTHACDQRSGEDQLDVRAAGTLGLGLGLLCVLLAVADIEP